MWQKIVYTPWHLMRWVRLIAGIFAVLSFSNDFLASTIQPLDYLILLAGFYFLYKALFNTGCEVVQNYTPTEDEISTVDYEEIK